MGGPVSQAIKSMYENCLSLKLQYYNMLIMKCFESCVGGAIWLPYKNIIRIHQVKYSTWTVLHKRDT